MAANLQLVITAVDKASGVIEGVEKKSNRLGKAVADVGKIAAGFVIGNAVTAAAGQVQSFVSGSIDAAKDLGESLNAVNVVFGESAQTILDWGKSNATSFGLSNRQFNQLVTPLGAMLTNYGFSADDAAAKSIDLTKRAADMASVFNVDVSEALEAIQAGLRGEADPLEKFGVGLNAAAISSKALAMTGKTVEKTLTDQEKKAAALALIFEQTDKVQGDFANTSDEVANAQRIAAAKTEELQAKLGVKLLPITLKVTQAKLKLTELLVNKIIPAIDKYGPILQKFGENKVLPILVEAARELTEAFKQARPVLEPVFNFFKENEWAVLALVVALGALAIALGGPVTAIIGLITVGTLLLAHWDEIKAKGTEVWDAIQRKIEGIPILGAIIEDTFNTIKILIESYVRTYIAIIEYLFATIRNVFAIFKAVWEGDWNAFWEAIKNQFAATVNLFDDIFGIALDAIRGTFNSKAGMLVEVGSDIANSIWGPLKTGAVGAINFIIGKLNWFIRQFNSVAGFFEGIVGRDLTPNQLGYIGEGGGGGAGSAIGFAKGGIVTRPTLAMIGEAGPEAVIPLSRGAMGGDVHLHIHTPFNLTNPADQERAALQIAQLVRRQMRFA